METRTNQRISLDLVVLKIKVHLIFTPRRCWEGPMRGREGTRTRRTDVQPDETSLSLQPEENALLLQLEGNSLLFQSEETSLSLQPDKNSFFATARKKISCYSRKKDSLLRSVGYYRLRGRYLDIWVTRQ